MTAPVVSRFRQEKPDPWARQVEVRERWGREQVARLDTRIDDLITAILETFVFAAHGTMMQAAATVAGADWGLGWVPIDSYDTVEGAHNVTMTPSSGTFSIDHAGNYLFLFFGSATHDESQQGRETNIRLYNVTAGAGADPVAIPIARNQPGSLISVSTAFAVTEGDVGSTYRVEIGGGDSVTSVVWTATSLTLANVGLWQEGLGA